MNGDCERRRGVSLCKSECWSPLSVPVSVSVCVRVALHVCVTSGVRKSSLPVQVCPHVTAVRSRLRIADVWHHKIFVIASFSAWQHVDTKNRSHTAG